MYNKLRRITTNHVYFPEIDGIRFLAIIMVVLFHIHGFFLVKTNGAFADTGNYQTLITVLEGGDSGVELFFVLSGFILCLPFAQQYINQGKKVNLKKYYLRRVTRLEPPYIIAMTGLFLATWAMGLYDLNFLTKSFAASLVYLHNIIFEHVPYLTVVAWSLEIEIQFYLLAPLLFKLLTLKPLVRRPLIIAVIIGMVLLQKQYDPEILSLYGFIQYFLAGILLADLYVSGVGELSLKRGFVSIAGILLLIAILFIPYIPEFWSDLAFPLLIMIFYLIVMKNNLVKKVFSYKFIPIIGGMCYSIYLLHYSIISMVGRFTINIRVTDHYLPNLLFQTFLLLIPILLISTIYYIYIERPFMSSKLMDKLMRRKMQEHVVREP